MKLLGMTKNFWMNTTELLYLFWCSIWAIRTPVKYQETGTTSTCRSFVACAPVSTVRTGHPSLRTGNHRRVHPVHPGEKSIDDFLAKIPVSAAGVPLEYLWLPFSVTVVGGRW